jgi:hypothetical protein
MTIIYDKMQHKLDELIELLNLFQSVENANTKDSLLSYFEEVIDNSVNRLDECYYELMVNKNKKLDKRIKNDKHYNIMHTQDILKAFMPYIIAYSAGISNT